MKQYLVPSGKQIQDRARFYNKNHGCSSQLTELFIHAKFCTKNFMLIIISLALTATLEVIIVIFIFHVEKPLFGEAI